MQTMRPHQISAVRMALAALLALQSELESSATAVWQSSDQSWRQNGMLPGTEGRQASSHAAAMSEPGGDAATVATAGRRKCQTEPSKDAGAQSVRQAIV